MPEIPIQPYKRISSQQKSRYRLRPLSISFEKSDVLRLVFSFLLGRYQLFGIMTPFLISFYAADYKKEKSFFSLLGGTLGVLSMGMGIESFKYVIAMLIYSLYAYLWGEREHKVKLDMLLCFLTLFAGGYLMIALDGFVIYDTIFLALECGVSMLGYLMCRRAYPMIVSLLSERQKKRWVLNREFICCCFFLSCVLCGIYTIAVFRDFHLVNVIALLFVIGLTYRQGIHLGVLAGAVCGMVIGIADGNVVSGIGFFALCALAAGALTSFGKIPTAVGVMTGALFTSVIGGSGGVLFANFYEVAAACLGFILTPTMGLKQRLLFENGVNPLENEKEFQHMQQFLQEKLNRTSDSFYHLSHTFDELAQRRIATCRGELNDLVTECSKRICQNCSMFAFCWKQDFSRTYGAVYAMVETMEEKGYVDPLDAEEDFSKHCSHVKDLTNCLNHLYELYKVNLHWTNELSQNRQLIAQQYHGISKIIARLSSNVSRDILFQNDCRYKISAALYRAGFHVQNVRVARIGDEKAEVSLALKKRYSAHEFAADAALQVSCVLRKSMVVSDDVCAGTLRTITLVEADRFSIKTGMAMVKKANASVCGDSFDFYRLPQPYFVMALSDGMGSGASAARESQDTLKLLKEFLCAGFERQTALQLINSILLLKSAEESFATIDLSMIDLTNGRCEFVKIGSATGFVKHLSRVETISSTSLPAGILSSLDAELSAKTLEDGDMVILMSDGVLESDKNHAISEEWVLSFLQQQMDVMDPQELADNLMAAALENCKGIAHDDMTILVGRVVARQN